MLAKLIPGSILVAVICAAGSAGWGQDEQQTYDRVGQGRLAVWQDAETSRLSALYDEAAAAYAKKQYDRTISFFDTILKANLESRIAAVIYTGRAQAFTGTGEFKKAITDATEAIRLDRRLGAAYDARGVAYANIGETVLALRDFETAVRLDTNDKWARLHLEHAQRAQRIRR